jgi:AcrR family transcriptional regulator
MSKSEHTRSALLQSATRQFGEFGYSNASLRQIAGQAGVDVALISRYFGGKLGLFDASLKECLNWPELLDPANDPIETAVEKFTDPTSEDHKFSTTRMIVLNADDPIVGERVRTALFDKLIDPLEARMDGTHVKERLAMFIAVIVGASITRYSLQVPGMANADAKMHSRQLRHLIDAALSFKC